MTGNGGPLCAKSGAHETKIAEAANTEWRIPIVNAEISTNLRLGSAGHPTIPRARAPRTNRFGRWWEHVVVHRNHHRDEHDGVVEQMELDARDPVLDEARRHRTAEKIVSGDRLNLQQQVLEVMEELNTQRNCPPAVIERAGKAGTQEQ